MPKLSYKERARRRREQEILRTAARMIRDSGYNNLNMDDLAEEVGISKPTLYQHFKGKDDMVARTMLQSMQEMEAHIAGLEGTSAMHKLEQVMRYMLEAHADPDGFSVAIIQDVTLTLQHLMHANDEMQTLKAKVGQHMRAFIAQAKAEGNIRQDLPDVVIVSAMFANLSILRGPEVMRDYSVPSAEIIEHIIQLFRQGVAPAAHTGTPDAAHHSTPHHTKLPDAAHHTTPHHTDG